MPNMLAVTFSSNGRLYYLDAADVRPKVGDRVLFPTSVGTEVVQVIGSISSSPPSAGL